jgi:hypothetical protein
VPAVPTPSRIFSKDQTMPQMSLFERTVCRSGPWRALTTRVVLQWALQGLCLVGRDLEIGAGSGMAAELLTRYPHLHLNPHLHLTVTDVDTGMLRNAVWAAHRCRDRRYVAMADATRCLSAMPPLTLSQPSSCFIPSSPGSVP